MAENVKQFKTFDGEVHDIEDTQARNDLLNVYSKTETDTLLATKVDSSEVYDKATLNSILDSKADEQNVYSKVEINALLDSKANTNDVYTKAEVDTELGGKANVGASYTKSEEDNLLLGKANTNNVYTKTEADTLLSAKADASDVYTKTESDTLLGEKANANEVYTITQTDALLGDKADVSTVNGLASTVAQLDGKVNLNYQNTAKLDSANTFEGPLKVIDNAYRNTYTDIDLTDTPSSTTWGKGGIVASDVNNTRFAYIQPLQNTDGSVDLRIDIDTNNNPNGRVIINGHRVATTLEQFTVTGQNLWATGQGSVTIPKSAWYQVGVSSGYVSTNPDVSSSIPKSCLVYGSGTTADYRNYFLEKGMTLYCTAGAGHDLYELSTS